MPLICMCKPLVKKGPLSDHTSDTQYYLCIRWTRIYIKKLIIAIVLNAYGNVHKIYRSGYTEKKNNVELKLLYVYFSNILHHVVILTCVMKNNNLIDICLSLHLCFLSTLNTCPNLQKHCSFKSPKNQNNIHVLFLCSPVKTFGEHGNNGRYKYWTPYQALPSLPGTF